MMKKTQVFFMLFLLATVLVLAGTFELNIEGNSVTYEASEPRVLLDTPDREYHPKWSPKDDMLMITKRKTTDDEITLYGYYEETDENFPVLTGVEGDLHFSFSPDGETLAIDLRKDGGRPYIAMLSLEDGQISFPQGRTFYGQPQWTSKEDEIGFQSFDDYFYIGNIRTGRLKKICYGGEYPKISPDDQYLLYGQNGDIWKINLQTKQKIQLTDTPSRELQPAWFPDGKMIVFSSEQDGTRDIWIMSADGGEAVNLTNHRGNEWYVSVHPDGTRIAFTMDWNGSLGVGVVEIESVHE